MTREELLGALRRADAAGDVEAARAIVRRLKAVPAAAPAPEGGLPNVEPAVQRGRDDKRIQILQNELATETAAGRADNVASISKELQQLGVRVAPAAAPAPAQTAAPDLSGQPAGATPLPTPPQGPPRSPDGFVAPVQPVADVTPGGFGRALAQEHPLARTLAGFGTAPMQAYQSIKQLAGGTVPEHQIQEQRDLASGYGLAGNVAGNVGMMALPAGAAVKGIQALPKAQALTRALAVPAVAGAEAGLLTPVLEDESRLKNAATGAVLSKALQAGGRVLSGMVTPSDVGRKLMDQGIQPTVGQGSKGFVGGAMEQLENIAAALPFGMGAFIKKGSQRTSEEATAAAAPKAQVSYLPASKATPGRGEFIEEMRDQHNTVQRSVTAGKRVSISKATRQDIVDAAMLELKDMPTSAVRQVQAKILGHMPKLGGSFGLDRVLRAESIMDEQIAKYELAGGVGDMQMAKAFQAAKQKLQDLRNSKLSPDDIAKLDELAEAKAYGKIFEKAASAKGEGGADTTAKNLIAAVEATTPSVRKNIQTGRLQEITDPLKAVLEKDATRDAGMRRIAYATAGLGVGASPFVFGPAAIAPALAGYGLAKLGTTRGGARFLFGENEWQKKLAESLRQRGAQGTAAVIGGSEGQRE